MPAYPQSLSGNVNYLQQQLLRAGTTRMGPTSIGPGDGHVRLNDGTNDTGYLDFNGVQVRYRGALTGMTWLTESFATSLESHTAQIDQNRGRLDGHDTTLGQHASRMDGIDGTLAKKAWTTYVDQQDSNLSGRVTTAQARADNAHADAAAAQARADDAHADAATAQSRADAAYSAAATALQRADQAMNLASQIDAWLRQHTAYPNSPA